MQTSHTYLSKEACNDIIKHIKSIVHMNLTNYQTSHGCLPSALREQKALSVHSLRSGDNRVLCQFRAKVELGTHSRATIFCGQFHQIDRELKGKNDLKTKTILFSICPVAVCT
jgi:hypothetical protein